MAKIKRVRTKNCHLCGIPNDTLFRVRIERDGAWIFLCRTCLEKCKPSNEHYQYGGTWKSKKR